MKDPNRKMLCNLIVRSITFRIRKNISIIYKYLFHTIYIYLHILSIPGTRVAMLEDDSECCRTVLHKIITALHVGTVSSSVLEHTADLQIVIQNVDSL